MSKTNGPVAAMNSDETEVRERMARSDARRKAFAEWKADEADPGINRLGLEVFGQRELVEHLIWRAFIAGERHGRAQLDAILSNGRREA